MNHRLIHELDKCRKLGLAFLPYSPLGGTVGAKAVGQTGPIAEIAGELVASPQQVVLHKYERMIPIPGVSRLETLESSAQAADVKLTTEQFAKLNIQPC